MVSKWISDTRVTEVVESLRKIRIELKSKVRHQRDRLSRKEKREAIKKDPSLKPVKRPKPAPTGLAPQSELYKQMLRDEGIEDVDDAERADYYVPQVKKKKNRLGQRARKRLAEEAETALAKQRDYRGPNRKDRRSNAAAADPDGRGPVLHETRTLKRQRESSSTSMSSSVVGTNKVTSSGHDGGHDGGRDDDKSSKKSRHEVQPTPPVSSDVSANADPSSHPSWHARSVAKEKEKNATFAGAKKTFDDSDDDE